MLHSSGAFQYTRQLPAPELAGFVESYWELRYHGDEEKPVILLPDGRIDLSFTRREPYRLALHGLESRASRAVIPPHTAMMVISFYPTALDLLFAAYLPLRPDSVQVLPADHPLLAPGGANTFADFCIRADTLLPKLLAGSDPDPRKLKLFRQLYASNGAVSVAEASDHAGWSSRQINRWFRSRLGMPLKTYIDILRFRASFGHIREGRLFPEQDFADQSHFIREVRRFAGVSPKALQKNENDRFIQFSTLPRS
ncbi:MAG: AraC family transcriptional regulator [Mucilaginibacter polytrichastri]|nr:AraC family transcriptional regulator [Mucilaginibacter polytrichastri]